MPIEGTRGKRKATDDLTLPPLKKEPTDPATTLVARKIIANPPAISQHADSLSLLCTLYQPISTLRPRCRTVRLAELILSRFAPHLLKAEPPPSSASSSDDEPDSPSSVSSAASGSSESSQEADPIEEERQSILKAFSKAMSGKELQKALGNILTFRAGKLKEQEDSTSSDFFEAARATLKSTKETTSTEEERQFIVDAFSTPLSENELKKAFSDILIFRAEKLREIHDPTCLDYFNTARRTLRSIKDDIDSVSHQYIRALLDKNIKHSCNPTLVYSLVDSMTKEYRESSSVWKDIQDMTDELHKPD